MAEHKFRCGDVARAEGTDYDIEVSYADHESGNASWCGWPEGYVEIAKLTLVEACSDEDHRKAVARWLDGPRSSDHARDHRRDTIERLYRPRAYTKRIWDDASEQARRAVSHADRCERLYRAACLDAREDVAPLEPAAAPGAEPL